MLHKTKWSYFHVGLNVYMQVLLSLCVSANILKQMSAKKKCGNMQRNTHKFFLLEVTGDIFFCFSFISENNEALCYMKNKV